jgi:hypothetical protein
MLRGYISQDLQEAVRPKFQTETLPAASDGLIFSRAMLGDRTHCSGPIFTRSRIL